MDYEPQEDGLDGFDPIAIYDRPGVAFTQFLDDELSWRSFKQTMLDPSALSPMERDSFVDRLKQQYGGTALSNTIIDLASNPFVWMTFVTSPAAGKALSATGRIFTGSKYSDYVIGNKSVLKSLGLLNAHQMGQGTALPTVLNSTTKRISDLVEQEQIPIRSTLATLQSRISQRFGLKTPLTSLRPDRAPEVFANINGEYISLPTYLKRSQVYMHAVLDGMNQQVVRKQANMGMAHNVVTESGKKLPVNRDQAGLVNAALRDLDEGKIAQDEFLNQIRPIIGDDVPVRVSRADRITNEIEQRVRPNLDPDDLMSRWLETEGFAPYMSMTRGVMKQRYGDLFLNKAGGFDDDKVLRLYGSLKKSVQVARAEDVPFLASEYFGHMNNEIAEEVVKKLRNGSLDLSEFKGLIRDQRSLDDLETYMPRNAWSNVQENGQKVRVDRVQDSRRKVNFASGRVRNRSVSDGIYDPEDLEEIAKLYFKSGKQNSNLENFIGQNRKLLHEAFRRSPEDGIVQVSNLDFEYSVNKYLKQTRNDVAFYADPLPGDVRLALKDFPVQKAKDARREVASRMMLGGSSRYDVYQTLVRDLDLAGDKATSSYIQGVLIPRIRGEMKINDLMGYHAMLGAQKIAGGLANSKFMGKVGGENAESSRFIGSMKSFAKRDLTEFDGSEFGRGAATALYSSHLGFNPASAVLNLFQPLLFAQTWMGAGNMSKGYGQAFKQYFGYLDDRIKLGVRGNADDIDELRRKHFRLSNVEGEDLLNIRASSYELLDQVAFSTIADKTTSPLKYALTELPLKLFQHTEIFNRVATGEAAFAATQAAGRVGGMKSIVKNGLTDYKITGDSKDIFRSTDSIKSMVQNTQFGSDIVNSPAMFQQGFLSLPWARQFLTFPLRTLTSWTDTAPMINQGRRTWGLTGFETQGKYSAMFHDMVRTLGFSAAVYEVGKNALGMDFSKGLGAQTMWESTIVGPMFTSDRASLGYKMPIPPIIDLAMDGTQAMLADDKSVLGAVVPRVLPGGIALQRALNLAPQIGSEKGPIGGLQREFTDFNQMNADGQVPTYRSDGTVIQYEPAVKRILSSVGLGPYMNKQNQELHKFMVSNREQFNGIKADYINALLNNNSQRANAVSQNFERKFGMPLTVTQQQIDRAIQVREVPLRERMYERINPQIRNQYKPILERAGGTIPGELDRSTAEKSRATPSVFDNYVTPAGY